jgi:N-acetylglucosamine-6-phosphate deacetylase
MSGHHHRNPGVVTAALYFDELYCEVICDGIHVCPNTVKAFFKAVGEDRFVMITDALKIKHSEIDTFQLFGLDCVRKNGAAYLLTGPLAGSLLTMDQGLRNLRKYITNISLIQLMKVSSYNASKSLHLSDRGLIEKGRNADIVLLNEDLYVSDVYKLGKKVY